MSYNWRTPPCTVSQKKHICATMKYISCKIQPVTHLLQQTYPGEAVQLIPMFLHVFKGPGRWYSAHFVFHVYIYMCYKYIYVLNIYIYVTQKYHIYICYTKEHIYIYMCYIYIYVIHMSYIYDIHIYICYVKMLYIYIYLILYIYIILYI